MGHQDVGITREFYAVYAAEELQRLFDISAFATAFQIYSSREESIAKVRAG